MLKRVSKFLSNLFSNKKFFCIFVGILVFFVISTLKTFEETRDIKPFDTLENVIVDLRFFYKEINKNKYISHETMVAGFDDESITQIGKWPWYREVHGEFINKLQQFSPLALHLDVIFNLPEQVPQKVKDKLENEKPILEKVQTAFQDLDNSFATALSKYDNIYIDQFLIPNRILVFNDALEKKFRFNEEILKRLAVPVNDFTNRFDIQLTANSVYTYTEPLLEDFVANAIPSVVNAVPDRDHILRSAALIFPYSGDDKKLHFFSSIYLNLLLVYYGITLDDVELDAHSIHLRNAKAPHLDPETKEKIEEEISIEELKKKLVNDNFQKDYDQNFYNFIVNQFRIRFVMDEEKVPEFAMDILVEGDKWIIFRGKEIFDAAKVMGSKRVRVHFHQKRDIEVPTIIDNKDNPFSFLINYAAKERELVADSQNNITETFSIPTISYNSIYQQPYYPKMPPTDENGNIQGDFDRHEFENWFRQFVRKRIHTIQQNVYGIYGEVENNAMFQYAIQDNPYEGAFIFYDVYLNQLELPLDKKVYLEFIQDFFMQNGLPGDHSLITDFTLEEGVAMEYLIDAYQENYRKFYKKVVFAGAATTGMARDVHKTPHEEMFGIYTIVNAFNTIIKENFLIRSSKSENQWILLIVCLSLAIIYISMGNYLKYTFFVISIFTMLIVSIYYFVVNHYILYTSTLIYANVSTFIIMTLYSLLGEERNKKFLRSTFSTYLSPEVINDMYEKKEMPTLGGEEKYITAYFTDIQSFSSFSEMLSAEQLVELLNEYLGAMTDILLEQKGTLDKYEGDAIIAFFGAPLNLPDAAYRACLTGVLMQEKLLELREKWNKEIGDEYEGRNLKNISEDIWPPKHKWPKLVHHMRMRIGINSGNIVVGNMGSLKRQNYTMVGDDVNLAARLESAAKQYGIFTVASGKTMKSELNLGDNSTFVKEQFETRLLDKIVVVGKIEPVELYEILGRKDEIADELIELKKVFDEALELYLDMKWLKAKAMFEKAEKLEPYLNEAKTTPSRQFIEKCLMYKKAPPKLKGSKGSKGGRGKKWDGVTVLTSK